MLNNEHFFFFSLLYRFTNRRNSEQLESWTIYFNYFSQHCQHYSKLELLFTSEKSLLFLFDIRA